MILIAGALAVLYGSSGVIRSSFAKKRLERASRAYDEMHARLSAAGTCRDQLLQVVAKDASRGVKHIVIAQRLLSPYRKEWSVSHPSFSRDKATPELVLSRATEISSAFYSAGGVAAGLATAGGLWLGASVLGISSTGLPIIFLHGAALHNAAMACLGGGALVSGGGGMVAGGAVLAAAVIIPAAVVTGWKTNGKANELNQIANEIENANKTNVVLYDGLAKGNLRLRSLQKEITSETDHYSYQVKSAYRKLFRLGILSHWYRKIRVKLGGTYYQHEDAEVADGVTLATTKYIDFIEKIRSESVVN